MTLLNNDLGNTQWVYDEIVINDVDNGIQWLPNELADQVTCGIYAGGNIWLISVLYM